MVLLDPDVADDELRARLLSTVPEVQLREDQSDLANWTRSDRSARFEQTAERHAGSVLFRLSHWPLGKQEPIQQCSSGS